MGAKRPLILALAISLIGHIAFVHLFPRTNTRPPVARFDVALVLEEPVTASEVQENEALSETEPLEAPVPEQEQTVVEEESPPADKDVVAEAKEVDPDRPAAVLDLSRPRDWDQIVNEIPAPSRKLAFNPSLGVAVQKRHAERQREALVASRRAAVYGVTDADYERIGVRGQELKMDGGCVTLVEDKGVEEGQRWWASQCTETRQNPFTLPTIEYDALGRAVVE